MSPWTPRNTRFENLSAEPHPTILRDQDDPQPDPPPDENG